MTDQQTTTKPQEQKKPDSNPRTPTASGPTKSTSDQSPTRNSTRGGSRPDNKRRSGSRRRDDRASRSKPEFDQRVLDIRRVSRVVEGGRRFSFRVTLVAGDHRGRVGVGVGKAMDTPTAIEKAFRAAKRGMIKINATDEMSIPCEVAAKYNSSRVFMQPSPGKGIIAGSAVRPVVELAGLQDISTKVLSRSKNSLNNARATIAALSQLPAVSKTAAQPAAKENKNL